MSKYRVVIAVRDSDGFIYQVGETVIAESAHLAVARVTLARVAYGEVDDVIVTKEKNDA